MKSLLIIRLHPVDPVTGQEFTKYLENLSIKAFDISYKYPKGVEIGVVKYLPLPANPMGTVPPPVDHKTRIVQHYAPGLIPMIGEQPQSLATAVIEIPDPGAGKEYKTADIRLSITRNSSDIVHKQEYYNVQVRAGGLPVPASSVDPNEFPGWSETSLYLALPSPGQQLSPTVSVPEDGTAPNFANLRTAVETVLKSEPGSTTDIGNLSRKKSHHIAYEIVWEQKAGLLPSKPMSILEKIYTGPQSSSSDEERDRRVFEGELLAYYTKHNTQADRMANFVFSLSAAIWCEEKSKKAKQAGFYFPVFPASPKKEAKVLVTAVGTGKLNPAFKVPAEYFYGLTAILPPQVNREQRYNMTVMNSEKQTVDAIDQAIEDQVLTEPSGINRFQVARRLRALGLVNEKGTPKYPVANGSKVQNMLKNWLADIKEDINEFWKALSNNDKKGHLDLILCAVTKAHTPLVTAIKKLTFGVTKVEDLRAKTNEDWEGLLHPAPTLLPGFTKPGTTEERTQAFIRYLRKFFEVPNVYKSPATPGEDVVPVLDHPEGNPLDMLLSNYPGGFSFSGWDPTQLASTLEGIFPGDSKKKEQFIQWLNCIKGVLELVAGITPVKMQFSVIEALWARGFTNKQSLSGFSFKDFKEALVGSVAYDYAQTIWTNAGVSEPDSNLGPEGFKSVNPDGSIVNCVPPAHLSPLGPVAYLYDLLQVTKDSSCENPLLSNQTLTLAKLLKNRRGSLQNLKVTQSNLKVPIPLIDMVNESLEYMVAEGKSSGTVYNTADDQVEGHQLTSNPNPSLDTFQHDPNTMFEALSEHSTAAAPTVKQKAYHKLKGDFSTCNLPYSQPIDVSRTYLEQMGTSRFEVMRRFRQNITEFVLDLTKETTEFQKHLWRYPVRIKTAIEYLGITPEEYNSLFQKKITNGNKKEKGKLLLYQLYGFQKKNDNGQDWTEIVIKVSEFLERTCLTYCEFIALWKSEFVKFSLKNHNEEGFPECEPCCLDKYVIEFIEPADTVNALKQLVIFIRLWQKLQTLPKAKYDFTELGDICKVLELFKGVNVNPDFIRQLVAFQMFRDDFQLSLTDSSKPVVGATGAERLHLLAFWVPGASKWNWAVDHLLYQIQQYAINIHGCSCRDPEFIKLLKVNLDPLSALAGFNPNNSTDTWFTEPTHTLRFAEILAKIYASQFNVGELLFLFTNNDHLQGDDPFPLQTKNEAKDSPLGLPDDEDENSLLTLRKKLMAVEVTDQSTGQWTWTRMDMALRNEFGYIPSVGNDRWLSLGHHFFPTILTESGISVSIPQRQYRVSLTSTTSELMWNTPPDGPFRWDALKKELWTQIPITDEAVLAKLSRIRQLSDFEQNAVSDLYFLPRVDLASIAFIFNNFGEAQEQMIQESNEAKRWAWFQREFDCFYQRCKIITEHLAAHSADAVGSSNPQGTELAKLLLKNLWADENMATDQWEKDDGQSPSVTWEPQPRGGAFAALLGLTGTGMQAEYFDADLALRWREVRGGTDAFGPEENAWNAPIPTIMPAMDFTLSSEQLRFAAIRNGFAMANIDGEMLGGAEPFTLQWKGLFLIEQAGQYEFSAGAPTLYGDTPDFKEVEHTHCWRIILERGQKTWVLLSHNWPDEEAPPHCAKPITLKKGFYKLKMELERKPLVFDGPEDVCRQSTGFQLKYKGPDVKGAWSAVPYDKLFRDKKNTTLEIDYDFPSAVQNFLAANYTSTIRDIRRTYQRAFKTMLLVERLNLSVQPIADDGQSELGYILSHPVNFLGQSYYRKEDGFVTHKANFDLNFLPVLDNYEPPMVSNDQRVAPSLQRQQAMFDWWERLFDYTVMRRETHRSPEQPAWLLFHESAELHRDKPADLVRHLEIDLRHDTLVLNYYNGYQVTSADLKDDRWAVRVWQAEKWIRILLKHFYPQDIRKARPDLWASDDPTDFGNPNLTQFYRDGCIENHEPRRYEEIKRLNDDLRQRGRAALIAYLTHMNRVILPWGGFAVEVKDLSELLLLDVETGVCQKASRIEEAITAVQLFIQRARLGLETKFPISSEFLLAWDRHFATFRIWEMCKRRFIYKENWIEWTQLQEAKQTEAFRFMESELRSATLTMPVPGGLSDWNGSSLPQHSGVSLLQSREPATIELLQPGPEGLDLMGTPDRHSRPAWLAPLNNVSLIDTPNDPSHDPTGVLTTLSTTTSSEQPDFDGLPMWLQAAVRLGTKFIRVAAAGIPLATTTFEPKCDPPESSPCCTICGKSHPALMDEYYFWIEESRYYDEEKQVAEWGATADSPQTGKEGDLQTDWHRPEKLPGLLDWKSKPLVHLRWCCVHNGEFQPPRQSSEGVRIKENFTPSLVFSGRGGDSIYFEVNGGEAPKGYAASPPPGFRYDLVSDEAIILPQVAEISSPDLNEFGGLAAYPFFAWFEPGAPLLPSSLFSPAIAMAGHLRAHCRFEEALKWYELVYNPLFNDNTWIICQPDLSDLTGTATTHVPSVENSTVIECCCASDSVSEEQIKDRSFLMHYLDTLLQWGDALMRKNTPEAFQQARLIFDKAAKILGTTPITVLSNDNSTQTYTIETFESECASINPRLMCLYSSVTDRLALIHSCLNAKRLKNGYLNLDMPYFGNSELRDCRQVTRDVCADENDWCAPQSSYRFLFLVQKASEIANEVRSLGSALLAAYEKGDSEYLSSLRVKHEQQLLNLSLEVRQNQWRESDWQVQALEKTKQIAQTRLQYYNNLIANGLNSGESQYEPLIISSTTLRATGNISEAIGQAMNLIPDPHVGFPSNFVELPVGAKLSSIFSAAGTIVKTVADILATTASLGLTKAGWERREDEWEHQVDVLTVEIEQIERQILGAERQRDIAHRELNNHRQQIENTAEVHDFLRDKFTNHALYLWMQQETAAMYYQMYEMALHCARQAQRAYNFERGHTTRQFIPSEIWDNLHEGLLSGERLQLAICQMEKAYYDENVREYELTKQFSLRVHFPMSFLQLKTTGYCEIDIPEWIYDLDYPGHYMRRIKNVTMTIPCVVGPNTGVHCRLTLLSSRTRVDPRLLDLQHTCCHDRPWKNGYQVMPGDTRIVSMYAATEAIATSSGKNDPGMFELNFRDERYLPFEFAGAVSRWRIELPPENNHFELETLSDVVLHLNLTAREGGENLRKAANECAQENLPGAGLRFFDVRREFSDTWHLFSQAVSNDSVYKQLGIQLSRNMFPFLTGNKKIGVQRLEIFFEAPGADPSAHHIVEFFVGQRVNQLKEEKGEGDVHSIACVADANWPGMFHGELKIEFEAIGRSGSQDLGVFRFPEEVGEISDAYLFCGYKVW